MTKKIIILAIIVIIIILTIYLLKPKTAKVQLKTHAGIPFKWDYQIKDESIVKLKEKKVKGEKGNIAGGRLDETYIFIGLKEGETTITFNYLNFTTNEITKKKKYKAIVDKNKNINITKTD